MKVQHMGAAGSHTNMSTVNTRKTLHRSDQLHVRTNDDNAPLN
jgi:hypothetical protein